MATIPRYTDQVKTSAGYTGRFVAAQTTDLTDKALANAGESVMKAASYMGKIVEEEQEKIAQTQIQEANEKLLRGELSIRQKYLTTTGENALGSKDKSLSDLASADMDELKKSIIGGMNPNAAKEFEKNYFKRAIDVQSDVTNHSIKETNKHQEQVYQSSYKSAIDMVANDPSKADQMVKYLENDLIGREAIKKGWSGEQYREVTRKAESEIRTVQLYNMMKTDPVSAMELLDDLKAGDKLTKEDSVRISPQVEVRYHTAAALAVDGDMQKDYIKDIKNSDIKEAVQKEVDSVHLNRRKDINEKAGYILDKYDKILTDPKNKLPSREAFRQQVYKEMPDKDMMNERNSVMAIYDREVDRRRPKGEPGMNELNIEMYKAKIETMILKSGTQDPNIVFQWNKEGRIPANMVSEARAMIKENAKDPSVGKFVSDFSNEKKSYFGNSKESKEQFERRLQGDIRVAQSLKGAKLTDAEIRGIGERNLKAYADSRFFAGSRQDEYEKKFYRQPELGTAAYKRNKYQSPLTSLLQDVQDPQGKFVKKFGKKAAATAYADPTQGAVWVIDGNRKFRIGFDGDILELVK